jgi:GNAT superfamily N-acetyltransferase
MQFRHLIIPGDIGQLIQLHGTLYYEEYGYDETFEAYVARGLAEFVLNFDEERERIWLAEDEGIIIGSIAIVKFSEDVAQLRWYLLHPDHRGKGIGKKLIEEAILFCRQKKYKSCFLWTTSELTAAAYLYKKAGFVKTEENTHVVWGVERTEERYDLVLATLR